MRSAVFGLILLALGGLLTGPQALAEPFRFPGLGLAFDGPDGWHTLSGSEFRALPQDTDFGSEELNRMISEGQGPFLSLIKNPLNAPGVNPGIHLSRFPGRLIDAQAGAASIQDFLSRSVQNYQPISGPTPDKVGLLDGVAIKYSYTLVASAAVQYTIVETLWIIP